MRTIHTVFTPRRRGYDVCFVCGPRTLLYGSVTAHYYGSVRGDKLSEKSRYFCAADADLAMLWLQGLT